MLTSADIRRVLAHYTIGEPLQMRQATRGYVNETAFVDTAQGRFVVRRNHWRYGEAAMRYRHSLMNWLRERYFPAPALVPTSDGETLLALDRRFYEVQTFIDGADYDPTRPGQLESVGATLARYHRTVVGFPAQPHSPAPRYSAQAILALCEQLVERDIMGDLADLLAWYSGRATQLRSLLPEDLYAGLPALVVHGDIHHDNLRFDGDAVVALLDYDQAVWDARISDLADALVAFATRRVPDAGWGVFQGPLDEERAGQLLAAYAATAPLSGAEIAALPPLLEILWLQGELGRVISTPDGAPEYHRSVLEQGQALAGWIANRRGSLVEGWQAAAGGLARQPYADRLAPVQQS